MSAFIGPIHYWLYGKIKVVGEREEYVFQETLKLFGDTAEEIREQVQQSFGQPLPDKELGELIDHNNIHGWLQRQINIAESREAGFIKELVNLYGERAKELVAGAFRQHGGATGRKAKETGKYDLSTAHGVYKALNDFFLNGMPCDQGDMILDVRPDSLVWESKAYLQEPNWKRAGAAVPLMTELYQEWFKGFVTAAAGEDFGFRQTADRLKGDNANRYEIFRGQNKQD